MNQQPTGINTARELYRFIDKRQPEVKWAIAMSILMECLLMITSY